ncbi:MAG: S41 family peptidase [Bacteroidales bacterium]
MKAHFPSLLLSLAILLGGTLPSCDRTKGSGLPEETLILNHWIWDGMNDVYLWEADIPDLDPEEEADPEAFFYKLLYRDDRNSWITDDYDALVAMLSGVETATGMSVRPGLISETKVIGIVEYVSPNSPAEEEGISRGDILVTIDGQSLNTDNYYDLYYQTTATYGFGDWNGSTVVPNGTEISLTAIVLNQDPVVYHDVIDYEGVKVGYLVYTQFTTGPADEWVDKLDAVFQEFREAAVSTVVMDLRYNPGGSLDLSSYIASCLAPASVSASGSVFVNLVWNDFYNDFWPTYDLDEDGSARRSFLSPAGGAVAGHRGQPGSDQGVFPDHRQHGIGQRIAHDRFVPLHGGGSDRHHQLREMLCLRDHRRLGKSKTPQLGHATPGPEILQRRWLYGFREWNQPGNRVCGGGQPALCRALRQPGGSPSGPGPGGHHGRLTPGQKIDSG